MKKLRVQTPQLSSAIHSSISNFFFQFAPNVLSALEPALMRSPLATEIGLLLSFSQALYGTYLQVKQDRYIDFIKYILEDTSTFTKELFQLEEFQNGLYIAIDQYLKARSQHKRDLIKRIFKDFATSFEKEKFEIERLYDTIAKLSSPAIDYINFLIREILPNYYYITKELALDSALPEQEGGHNAEWWLDQNRKRLEPMTKYISRWIQKHYSPDSTSVSTKYCYDGVNKEILNKIFDDQQKQIDNLTEITSEFLTLGIFYYIPGTPTLGGASPDEYHFTAYGWKLIRYFEAI